MRPKIMIYVNDTLSAEMDADVLDIPHAQTWAEMNSQPGDRLRIAVDHSWVSPADEGVE